MSKPRPSSRSTAPIVRGLLAVAAVPALGACDDLRPFRPLGADLTRPSHLPSDALALNLADLSSAAGLDSLEDAFDPRPGGPAFIAFLETLAARPGTDTLWVLQRLAMLRADESAFTKAGLEAAIAAGTGMRARDRESPETLYIDGYIESRMLGLGSEGPVVINPAFREVAPTMLQSWRLLVEKHPTWRGPRSIDTTKIASRLAAFDEALKQLARTPSFASATILPSAPPPPAVIDASGLRAIDALRRFDASPDGERRGICSAWPPDVLASRETPELARLGLVCARFGGRLPDAAARLVDLAILAGATGIEGPLCRDWSLLVERFGAEAATAAMTAMPVRCSP